MNDQLDLMAGGEVAPGHYAHVWAAQGWRGDVQWWATCSCSWHVGGYPSEAKATERVWIHATNMTSRKRGSRNDE